MIRFENVTKEAFPLVYEKMKAAFPCEERRDYIYKINGGMVTVTGSVKPVEAYTSSATKVTFASGLPTAVRPETALSFVCQGSGMNRWTCGIEPDGTLTVSRYGITDFATVPTTAWLVFTITYAV